MPKLKKITYEFKRLRKLTHENIIQVYEVYIDSIKGKVYTVMELVTGKEMFEALQDLGGYSGK